MIRIVTNMILMGIVLYSQLYNSIVTIDYQMNWEYYAEVLCENKDEPELHCDGKCYFAKQLVSDNENSKNAEAPVLLLPLLRLFPCPGIPNILPIPLVDSERGILSSNQALPNSVFLPGIEHPPRV